MVDRFDLCSKDGTWDDNFEMDVSYTGDYVTYNDYETLEEEWKTLKRDYDELVKNIGQLYRDA